MITISTAGLVFLLLLILVPIFIFGIIISKEEEENDKLKTENELLKQELQPLAKGVFMKSKNRVSKFYKEGTKDWQDQYDMLLEDGLTCNDCVHKKICCEIFGQTPHINSGTCQWYPNKFKRGSHE